MTDTLLAHLSRSFAQGAENLATEALAYVLRHPEVAGAFDRHLRRFCPDLHPLSRFRTQIGDGDDRGIRDLVGSTSENVSPLVVEAKFDAALTDNQPVTYLRALARLEQPALLLFLVPTTRETRLWPRLLQRCADATPVVDLGNVTQASATHRQVTMAITSWSQLLDDLTGIPLSSANQQVLGEIAQLRGLCAREDREGFNPFDSAFLEGNIGRHLLDLDSILIEVVDTLRREGLADTTGYKWSAGQGWFGKYFSLAGHGVLLHVNFTRWGTQADTPLWLRVYPDLDPRVADALAPLRTAEPRQLFDEDGALQVPVFLASGADREECFFAASTAVRRVHQLLNDLPPLVEEDDTVQAEKAIV